jgi:hypothetical protein
MLTSFLSLMSMADVAVVLMWLLYCRHIHRILLVVTFATCVLWLILVTGAPRAAPAAADWLAERTQLADMCCSDQAASDFFWNS